MTHSQRQQRHVAAILLFLLTLYLVTWGLFEWLTTPSSLIALLLLGCSGLPWIFKTRRWQRRFSVPITALLLFYLIGTSPPGVAFSNFATEKLLPKETGTTADAVVVLGRGTAFRSFRSEAAADLWKSHRAPQVFISGMGDAPHIAEMLKSMDIPKPLINGEGCSQSTEENGLFTAAVLYPQGVRQILLVTDLPHMLRSLLVFRSFGFNVTPHHVPLPSNWTSPMKAHVIFREYLGLVAYAILGRFTPRPNQELLNPSSTITERIQDWNCLINKQLSD